MTRLLDSSATIPGEHPLLEGDGSASRTARSPDPDLKARRAELEAIIRAWCEQRDV